MLGKIIIVFLFAVMPVAAQTAGDAIISGPTNAPEKSQSQTNREQIKAAFEHAEKVRAVCIEGRRLICGKILQVFPDGFVVESGYTNLLRGPPPKSWLVPGTVTAIRAKDLLEENKPDAMCIGKVFLTDTPKPKKSKPQQYDYVIIEAYPAGEKTYTELGTIQKTVRRFSANLPAAVRSNLNAEEKTQ